MADTTSLWDILKSGFNYFLELLSKVATIKVIVVGAIVAAFEWLVEVVRSFMPDVSILTTAMNAIPDSIWYFLDLFKFGTGVAIIAGAYAVRFMIRRIPVIG